MSQSFFNWVILNFKLFSLIYNNHDSLCSSTVLPSKFKRYFQTRYSPSDDLEKVIIAFLLSCLSLCRSVLSSGDTYYHLFLHYIDLSLYLTDFDITVPMTLVAWQKQKHKLKEYRDHNMCSKTHLPVEKLEPDRYTDFWGKMQTNRFFAVIPPMRSSYTCEKNPWWRQDILQLVN